MHLPKIDCYPHSTMQCDLCLPMRTRDLGGRRDEVSSVFARRWKVTVEGGVVLQAEKGGRDLREEYSHSQFKATSPAKMARKRIRRSFLRKSAPLASADCGGGDEMGFSSVAPSPTVERATYSPVVAPDPPVGGGATAAPRGTLVFGRVAPPLQIHVVSFPVAPATWLLT